MNKHKSNKIKENSNTVRHLIMGQIITTQNLVAIKEVRHAEQRRNSSALEMELRLSCINPSILGFLREVFAPRMYLFVGILHRLIIIIASYMKVFGPAH